MEKYLYFIKKTAQTRVIKNLINNPLPAAATQ